MSAHQVLQVAPQEWRHGCRMLRGAGAELEALGTRVLAGSTTTDAWSGLAALEQRARIHAMHTLIISATGPSQMVAAAVERCAAEAEAAAEQVRSWGRVQERAVAEGRALRAAGPPPEPVLEEVWRRRLLELEQQEGLARRRSREAEEYFAEAQRRTAATIEGAWSTVREIEGLARLANATWKGLGLGSGLVARLVLATDAALAMVRARWARGAAVRARAAERLRSRLGQLRTLSTPGYAPTRFKAFTMVPGPLGLAVSVLNAGKDVRTGGGYSGWRARVTRGLAGGALAGVPLLISTPLFPPGLIIGVSLISAYSAWSLGNTVWDGRGTVVRYARKVGRGLGVMRDRAIGVAKGASIRLQEVRDRAVVSAAKVTLSVGGRLDRARDTADSVLATGGDRSSRVIGLTPGGPLIVPLRESIDRLLGRLPGRLPEVEPMRRWWREVGQPIRLPAVPLGPVLRMPVDLGRLWP